MAVLFFDIDGTLATGTKVPESAEAALARTRARGNLVFICTGRPVWYARSVFGRLADGFVCCNGRLAVKGDETLIAEPVPGDLFARIREVLDEHGAGYAFFGLERAYFGGCEDYERVASAVHGACAPLDVALEQGLDLFSFDIYFRDASERLAIEQALGETCLVNPHGPHPSADVTPAGFGKGDACRAVIDALGVPFAESYAFGDGVNDISMVASVAHGCAMGNAVDELKEIAEFVTTDIDDDGVARGLARFDLA